MCWNFIPFSIPRNYRQSLASGSCGCRSFAEQLHQRFHFAGLQMAELATMAIPHLGIQLLEQPRPFGSDADENDAAVVRRPLALDQPALHEFVQQSRDIWCPGDELAAETERRHFPRMRRAKEAERVVLLCRQPMSAEQFIFQAPQPVVRPPK